jgi:pilus assembly protein Flp/PilA
VQRRTYIAIGRSWGVTDVSLEWSYIMNKFVLATRRFLRDEEGVTAIEYGLIAALIAVAIIAAVGAIGIKLDAVFDKIAASL